MNTDKYTVKKDEKIKLSDYPTTDENKFSETQLKDELIPKSIKKLKELHMKLHAQEEKGIVVVLQAMDAAGKDEAITYIFSNLTAQGLKTTSFKKPTETELAHDYLWRFREGMPARGQIGILNRSYYEEVIAPRVHNLLEETPLPDELIDENIWNARYRQINDFERYMVENGFPVVKFFFNMSYDEQRRRLLERMKNPEKNWEFSFNDVKEREHWDGYQGIFENLLTNTSTEYAPWYALPADDEWYSRYIVSEVMVEALQRIDPQYPKITGEEKEKLKKAIRQLEKEE
ncbi:PPK2 family polyphosphate kinase [Planococcus faecalis]|uniref:Polyphosphate--nucleotide phosphotransferase n=1 Tax=Planococcus faecalis TaxID=1598147 RepID=A0ABN4XJB9_9BACL|nr:PPK2 family polyphosphate kinase [Planococcus faecalis]AQU78563.1 polyphosphate--nucleotide phosphotransferase [Planococcus faecalis]OHX53246.1 polyphosphate--nucleotide phosphotransferase [Planococcus faecalis]